MAADAVYDAIKTYLSDSSVVSVLADPLTAAVPPIRFENEDFTKPSPPAPWISMALTGGYYAQQSIGASEQADNRWDESGHLWLAIFVPINSGASRARQIAKLLADLFRGQTLLSDSLEFLDTFIGGSGPAPDEGNWFELDLVIDWRRVEA
jgi:hypothetical protein